MYERNRVDAATTTPPRGEGDTSTGILRRIISPRFSSTDVSSSTHLRVARETASASSRNRVRSCLAMFLVHRGSFLRAPFRIAGLAVRVKVTIVRRREWSCARKSAAVAATAAAVAAAAASSGCKNETQNYSDYSRYENYIH